MERATFRKHEHLCGQLRIQEVFRTGRGFSDAPFRLVGKFMDLPTKAPAQVAFSVPRKHLRRAVDRNRMKRLMREAYRLSKARQYERLAGRTQQVAWLFIYQGKGLTTWEVTEQKISRSLDRWMKEHG
jgi:ribonuclease P protein component